MDTVLQLDRYFKENGSGVQVIGVPKTIDNDLPVTDHTPVSEAVQNIFTILCMKSFVTARFIPLKML